MLQDTRYLKLDFLLLYQIETAPHNREKPAAQIISPVVVSCGPSNISATISEGEEINNNDSLKI